jgi:hypothetical protein
MVKKSKYSGKRSMFSYWRSILALVVLASATFFNLYLIWGLFFVFWGILDIANREVFLVERITREDAPFLYWLIVSLWLGSGVYIVASYSAYYMNSYSFANTRELDISSLGDIKANKEESKMFSTAINVINSTQESEGVKKEELSTLRNESYKFSIDYPSTWQMDEDDGDDIYNLSIYTDSELNNINLTVVPYGDYYSLDDMIEYMKSEIEKEFYFIDFEMGKVLKSSDSVKDILYSHEVDGYKMDVTTHYEIIDDYCYVLISLKTDYFEDEAKHIDKISQSFEIIDVE